MFCSQCGAELANGAKFCMNCGASVQGAAAEPKAAEPQKTEPGISFTIGGNVLNCSNELVQYNKVCVVFREEAWKCREEFSAYYDQSVHSFDEVFERAIPKLMELIDRSVSFCVSYLMEQGIDYVDKKKVIELCGEDIDPEPGLKYYYDKAEEVEAFANEIAAKRNLARASRSSWSGGGFGIGGALKGAIKAGALNMGTNMVRGIGDALTNAGDRAMIAKKKAEVFADERTRRLLEDGVFDLCKNAATGALETLCAEGRIPEWEPDKQARERALAKSENYWDMCSKSHAYKAETVKAHCELLESAFHSEGIYRRLLILDRIEDENLERGALRSQILEVAEYFGMHKILELKRREDGMRLLRRIQGYSDVPAENIQKKLEMLAELREDYPEVDSAIIDKLVAELERKRAEAAR